MLLEDIDLPSCLSAVPRAAAMGRALRNPPRAQRPGQLTQGLQEEMDEHRELIRECSLTPGSKQGKAGGWESLQSVLQCVEKCLFLTCTLSYVGNFP